MARNRLFAFAAALLLLAASLAAATSAAAPAPRISVLVYHRFGASVSDSMTIRTSTLRAQLGYLTEHHYTVVPLRTVIAALRHETPPLAGNAVVVTVDDGHASVFSEMWPIVREFQVPVTLFIYPSAISNASYAMTWAELQTLQRTGLFDVQSHTYWHPNFAREKRRLTPEAYEAFATRQLCQARTTLGARLGVFPDVVAWPFGVTTPDLFGAASACGYVAGMTLDGRLIGTRPENLMALPRFLVTEAATGARFAAMLPPEAPR